MELLNRIQKELKVPKSQFNAFAKYNYRNCEDILEAVKPLLGEGILTLSDEVVEVGGRCYVKATATIVDPTEVEKLGEKDRLIIAKPNECSVTAYAREALDKKGMDEAQITGAASSYARKYALCGLFAIDDGEDADKQDNSAAKPAAKAPVETKKPTTPQSVIKLQKGEIKKLCDADDNDVLETGEDYATYVLQKTGLDLEPHNYNAIITRLKALK